MAYRRIIKWSSIAVGAVVLLGLACLVAAVAFLYVKPVYLSQQKAQILSELNTEHADYHVDFQDISVSQFNFSPGILIENAVVRLKSKNIEIKVPKIEMSYGISNLFQFTVKPTAVNFVNAEIILQKKSILNSVNEPQIIDYAQNVGRFAIAPAKIIQKFSIPIPRPRYSGIEIGDTEFANRAEEIFAKFLPEDDGSPIVELVTTKTMVANLQAIMEHQIWQVLQVNSVTLKQAQFVFVQKIMSGQGANFSNPFDLVISRYNDQNLSFALSGKGEESHWNATITANTNDKKATEVSLNLKNIRPIDFAIHPALLRVNVPINADISTRFSQDGFVEHANINVQAGKGQIVWTQDPISATTLQALQISVKTDDAAKQLIIEPSLVRADGFSTEITGTIDLPYQKTQNKNLRVNLSAQKTHIEGAQLLKAKDDAPDINLPNLVMNGEYGMLSQIFKIYQLSIENENLHLAGTGLIDISGNQPMVRFASENFTPITTAQLRTMWPAGVVPEAREWLMKNVISGVVTSTSLNAELTAQDLDAMANRGEVPKDHFHFETYIADAEFLIEGTNARLSVPNAKMETLGSAVSFSAPKAEFIINADQTVKVDLKMLSFSMPDAHLKVPTAHLNTQIIGSVPDITNFLMDNKMLVAEAKDKAFIQKVNGQFNGDLALHYKVESIVAPDSVDYNVSGVVENFTIPDVYNGMNVETKTAQIFATAKQFQMSGDTNLKGQMLSYKFIKSNEVDNKTPTILEFAMTDSIRKLLFPNSNLPFSGTVPLKLALNDDPNIFGLELDLKQAKIDFDVIGYNKKAGVSANFKTEKLIIGKGENPTIEMNEMNYLSSELSFKGNAKFSGTGKLLELSLPQVAWGLSGGQTVKDNFSVEVNQTNNRPTIKVNAQKFDARPFLQKLTISSASSGDDYKNARLEVLAKQAIGFGYATLEDLALVGEKTNGAISALTLSANKNNAPILVGKIQKDGVGPFMFITSTNAGLVLRFLNLTNSVRGGSLQFSEYLPQQEGKAVSGIIFIEDFSIENDKTISSLVGSVAEQNKIDAANVPMQFEKLRLEFTRAPNLITIQNSVMRGPVMGLTFEGEIDPKTNLLDITGTFVPLYGLNNVFSKIPVLGEFLGGGGKNEGLIGVTYAVRGSMSNSVLRINPISGIAPGFLRRIFDFEPKPLHPPKRPPIDLAE